MNEGPTQSPARLCAEIVAQARHAAEETVREARERGDALIAAAQRAAEAKAERALAAARREAERRRNQLLATVAVETNRIRDTHTEALLTAVRDEIATRLVPEALPDYRAVVVALVADALRHMDGNEFTVALRPSDVQAWGEQFALDVAAATGLAHPVLNVVGDPTIASGAIVRDRCDRQIWDNRLASRLDRMWPELRGQIADRCELLRSTPS